jgi:hypothetical protein
MSELQPGSLEVEIAVPIFLKSKVTEILSIGKSVRLIRYLDERQAERIDHQLRQKTADACDPIRELAERHLNL